MGKQGNKPLKKKEGIATDYTIRCLCCNKEYENKDFYGSDSEFYGAIVKIPYCKRCLDNLYQYYLRKCKKIGYPNPERRAVERICMALDVYYSDKIFDSAVKESESWPDATFISLYFKIVKLYQYRKKDYDSTIEERYKVTNDNAPVVVVDKSQSEEHNEDIAAAKKIFGNGFEDGDYLYLYEQYVDWTTRHECETKAQEEVFKRLCFKQLEILKATRRGDDTKELDTTFLKQLEAAKLQPKQNSGDTTANNQTFGTLIDKWENTRPIPEVDEDLRDVDKIGLYIDTFFKGHLAKMMGLKNGLSNLYTKFMKKYTVEKPEYSDEENSEVLFDAIFGDQLSDSNSDKGVV